MYLLAREWLGVRAAILASVAFTYAPFRLREISMEGDYAQLMGLALMPLLFWSLHRLLVLGRRRYLLSTTLLYGGLLLTHNVSAFLAIPVAIAYWLFLLYVFPSTRERIVPASVALVVGAGLAAFFWMPALLEQHLVQLDSLRSGDFHYSNNFLALRELFKPCAPLDQGLVLRYFNFTLGTVHLLLALPSLLPLRKARLRPVLLLAWSLLFFTAFLTLRQSSFIWENVPLLSLLQFPWRLLALAALPLAFLVGATLLVMPRRLRTPFVLAAGVGLVISTVPFLYPNEPFAIYEGRSTAELVTLDLEEGSRGTTQQGEYLPHGVDRRKVLHSPLIPLYLEGKPIDKLDRESLPRDVDATTLEHRANSDRFRFVSSVPFTATLHTLHYLGWRAYLDGQPVPIRPINGLISVQVPAGEHELLVRFESTPLRQAATGISWASLLGLVLAIWLWRPQGSDTPAYPSVTEPPIGGRVALGLSVTVLAIFAFKVLYVDPHTFWFRKESSVLDPPGCEHFVEIGYGGRAHLIGYAMQRRVVKPGGTVPITLFWRGERPMERNWSVFMHLKPKGENRMVAQADAPSPGYTDTRVWVKDKFVRDEHVLRLPPDISPGVNQVGIGLYDQRSWERLPLTGQKEDEYLLPQLIRAPPPRVGRGEVRKRSDTYTLGGNIRLIDYRIGQQRVRPGDIVELTLYWQAKEDIEDDWTVFAHLLGLDGQLLGQDDGYPVGGKYPTSIWLPGEIVKDERRMRVQANAGPGQYRIGVGMYDLATMERLPVVGAEGPLGESIILLKSTVEVR